MGCFTLRDLKSIYTPKPCSFLRQTWARCSCGRRLRSHTVIKPIPDHHTSHVMTILDVEKCTFFAKASQPQTVILAPHSTHSEYFGCFTQCLSEDDGDDSERSNDPSDSDTTPEQVCALQQLLMGIFDKVLKVSVTKSLPGHDVEAVALHVISDSPPLPPSLLAELYAGDGKWRARVEALLVAWGHNNTEWALSKVGGNTSTPLSQDPGQPSCPGADAAVTPPSYATTTEAGAAEVEREGVGMDCGGQFNVVMDQLFASHAPSSVMSVARHFSNGSTKLTLLSSNPHSAPPAAVDFQRLGDFGDQLRKCPPLSSEMDTLVETMGEMLRNLSLGQGPLPIGPPTVSSPVLRLEGVAADGPKRKAKAAAKRFTSGKKRSSQQENVSAAPLRLAKAEKKAAGKASKDAAAAGGNAQHILPPPFQPLSNVPAAAASEVAALQAGSSSIAPASASSTFTPGDDGGGMSAVQVGHFRIV